MKSPIVSQTTAGGPAAEAGRRHNVETAPPDGDAVSRCGLFASKKGKQGKA